MHRGLWRARTNAPQYSAWYPLVRWNSNFCLRLTTLVTWEHLQMNHKIETLKILKPQVHENNSLLKNSTFFVIFRNKVPWYLVDSYQRFGEICCPHLQGRYPSSILKLEAAVSLSGSEPSHSEDGDSRFFRISSRLYHITQCQAPQERERERGRREKRNWGRVCCEALRFGRCREIEKKKSENNIASPWKYKFKGPEE